LLFVRQEKVFVVLRSLFLFVVLGVFKSTKILWSNGEFS
jgi:hypothetical protein